MLVRPVSLCDGQGRRGGHEEERLEEIEVIPGILTFFSHSHK